jgi:hypothetical protein
VHSGGPVGDEAGALGADADAIAQAIPDVAFDSASADAKAGCPVFKTMYRMVCKADCRPERAKLTSLYCSYGLNTGMFGCFVEDATGNLYWTSGISMHPVPEGFRLCSADENAELARAGTPFDPVDAGGD